MKIGITCYPTYGGSGAVATELGIALAERGHEVHFVSYDQPFRLMGFHERVFFHAVEMAEYPLFEYPPYALALAVALHDAALKHELDLVHMHYAIPHAASAHLARQMLEAERPLKIVTTLHGTDITLVGQHPSFHAITRFSILQSDALTAVSRYLKDETVRDFSVPSERIEVIPNFVDTSIWRPDFEPCHRSKLAPAGEKIVMHVSNFRGVKRVTDVVSVFAKIRAAVPSRLVLVGDGPDRARAAQQARELGVEDHVLFLGKHQSVEELLSCADLFLLASETESFGLAALEAMACGDTGRGHGHGRSAGGGGGRRYGVSRTCRRHRCDGPRRNRSAIGRRAASTDVGGRPGDRPGSLFGERGRPTVRGLLPAGIERMRTRAGGTP